MKLRFYSVYQRIWHWIQAVSILMLLITGLAIHFPGLPRILPFERAVAAHTIAAAVFLGNALLGLFYYVTTGEILQLVPGVRGLPAKAAAWTRFYLRGIIRGDPHPSGRKPEERLNPLQRLTYLAILNVLLPLEAVTGSLLWALGRWPAAWRGSGLATLAIFHTLGAWLLAAFLLGHLYLITTGRTPAEHLKTMLSGVEERDAGEEKEIRA